MSAPRRMTAEELRLREDLAAELAGYAEQVGGQRELPPTVIACALGLAFIAYLADAFDKTDADALIAKHKEALPRLVDQLRAAKAGAADTDSIGQTVGTA